MTLKELLKQVREMTEKVETLETKEEVVLVVRQINQLLVDTFKNFQIVKRPKKA